MCSSLSDHSRFPPAMEWEAAPLAGYRPPYPPSSADASGTSTPRVLTAASGVGARLFAMPYQQAGGAGSAAAATSGLYVNARGDGTIGGGVGGGVDVGGVGCLGRPNGGGLLFDGGHGGGLAPPGSGLFSCGGAPAAPLSLSEGVAQLLEASAAAAAACARLPPDAAAAAVAAAVARRAAARTGAVVAVASVGLLGAVRLFLTADADPGGRVMSAALLVSAAVAVGVAAAALVMATLLAFRFDVPPPSPPPPLPLGAEKGAGAPSWRAGRSLRSTAAGTGLWRGPAGAQPVATAGNVTTVTPSTTTASAWPGSAVVAATAAAVRASAGVAVVATHTVLPALRAASAPHVAASTLAGVVLAPAAAIVAGAPPGVGTSLPALAAAGAAAGAASAVTLTARRRHQVVVTSRLHRRPPPALVAAARDALTSATRVTVASALLAGVLAAGLGGGGGPTAGGAAAQAAGLDGGGGSGGGGGVDAATATGVWIFLALASFIGSAARIALGTPLDWRALPLDLPAGVSSEDLLLAVLAAGSAPGYGLSSAWRAARPGGGVGGGGGAAEAAALADAAHATTARALAGLAGLAGGASDGGESRRQLFGAPPGEGRWATVVGACVAPLVEAATGAASCGIVGVGVGSKATHAAEAVSKLLAASVTEDVYGVAGGDLPVVFGVLLQLRATLREVCSSWREAHHEAAAAAGASVAAEATAPGNKRWGRRLWQLVVGCPWVELGGALPGSDPAEALEVAVEVAVHRVADAFRGHLEDVYLQGGEARWDSRANLELRDVLRFV